MKSKNQVKKPQYDIFKIKKPTQYDSVKSASSARSSNLSYNQSIQKLKLKVGLKIKQDQSTSTVRNVTSQISIRSARSGILSTDLT